MRQTVDGYVDMYIVSDRVRYASISDLCHILREASVSLLVLLRWAIPGPQNVERALVRLSRFFLLILPK